MLRLTTIAAIALCVLSVATNAVAQDDPTAEPAAPAADNPNALLVQRLIGEVWNNGQLEVLDEILTADFVSHGPAVGETDDLAEFRTFVEAWRNAFPDLQVTPQHVIMGEDRMVAAWQVTGTNTGPIEEIPATGQSATIVGMTMYRFEDGRIAESWYAWDQLDLLTQLGLVEEP